MSTWRSYRGKSFVGQTPKALRPIFIIIKISVSAAVIVGACSKQRLNENFCSCVVRPVDSSSSPSSLVSLCPGVSPHTGCSAFTDWGQRVSPQGCQTKSRTSSLNRGRGGNVRKDAIHQKMPGGYKGMLNQFERLILITCLQ